MKKTLIIFLLLTLNFKLLPHIIRFSTTIKNIISGCIIATLLAFYMTFMCGINCSAQDAGPKFKFESKSVKFEKVRAGEVLSFDYVFENTGVQPLIITNIKVSCGCTKPQWPKEPVKPGKKDTMV